MAEIRYIEGDVGPEILSEIGTGLIINHAAWSGPSATVRNIALKEAPEAGIVRIFILDHDNSDRFIRLFDQDGWTPCQGWGDLVVVRDGVVKKTCHKFASMTDVGPWLRSAATL